MIYFFKRFEIRMDPAIKSRDDESEESVASLFCVVKYFFHIFQRIRVKYFFTKLESLKNDPIMIMLFGQIVRLYQPVYRHHQHHQHPHHHHLCMV